MHGWFVKGGVMLCRSKALGLLLWLTTACQPEGPARSVESIDGSRSYQRHCATCHGALGRGDGPSAAINHPANLTTLAFHAGSSDAEIRQVIVEGRGLMPAWGHLADAELDALVAHVRTLREQPAP